MEYHGSIVLNALQFKMMMAKTQLKEKQHHGKRFITKSIYYIGQFSLHFDRVSFGNGTLYGGLFFVLFFFTLIRESIAYLFSVCASFFSFLLFLFIVGCVQQLQNRIYVTLLINRAI